MFDKNKIPFPVDVMTGVLLKYFACTKTPKTTLQ